MSIVELKDIGVDDEVDGHEDEEVSELIVASVDEGGPELDEVWLLDEEFVSELEVEVVLGGGVGGTAKDDVLEGVSMPSSGWRMSKVPASKALRMSVVLCLSLMTINSLILSSSCESMLMMTWFGMDVSAGGGGSATLAETTLTSSMLML